MTDAPRFALFSFGSGIFGAEDTAARVQNADGTTTYTAAAFDGPRASRQVVSMLNLGALPPDSMEWEQVTR